MRLAHGEEPFDLMKTEVVNKGYVDLHVGRNIGLTRSGADDEGDFETLEAL